MEKHGKLKLRDWEKISYQDAELVSTEQCIIIENLAGTKNQMLLATVETYDGTVLVPSHNIPKWLVSKIRTKKIRHNDEIIVTVSDSNQLCLENNEAILEIPKPWSSQVEDIFKERYTAEEVIDMITRVEKAFKSFYKSGISIKEREELLNDLHKELGLIRDKNPDKKF